ncbi:hypothetical protein CDL15_Pgr006770 [Punica granatum]|uniref:Origin recognition complex subunit 2 n=1 Tax=Punica granatum TaxID=22663 RepID=A0A218X7T5_PUNGR|nr:hypothetical protein CDL15_Pgr006770 [Punica granatum]
MEIDDVDEEEVGFSRNYFLAKESGSSSSKKSGRKVSDIQVVDEQELIAAVANIEPKHEKEIAALKDSYKSSYSEWVFLLRCGFGLLFYGFGSKKALIEDFASTALSEYTVVVVNGYLQSINVKQVVVTVAELLLEFLKSRKKSPKANLPNLQQPFSSRSMEDLFSFLDGSWMEGNDCFVCVVIHNIDGPGLRDSDTQRCLAQLAACSNVRIIASIDHVNSPLCMLVSSLYATCRERFLVSSQVTLNSHLTEFKDHELVKIKRHPDGEDCLHIPLAKEALEKLLSEIN